MVAPAAGPQIVDTGVADNPADICPQAGVELEIIPAQRQQQLVANIGADVVGLIPEPMFPDGEGGLDIGIDRGCRRPLADQIGLYAPLV
jgi:hypothetical protein